MFTLQIASSFLDFPKTNTEKRLNFLFQNIPERSTTFQFFNKNREKVFTLQIASSCVYFPNKNHKNCPICRSRTFQNAPVLNSKLNFTLLECSRKSRDLMTSHLPQKSEKKLIYLFQNIPERSGMFQILTQGPDEMVK